MEKERLTYAESIAFLANRANMELPEFKDDEKARKEQAQRNRMYDMCRDAALYYVNMLSTPQAKDARAYAEKRGLSPNICRAFGIGYAPESWDGLKNHLLSQGYREDEILLAGLAGRSRDGRLYDLYRNRLIFPIITERGRVVGFGARAINDEDNPKYINTGETPIYSKRNVLYALNMLKGGSHEDIIVCEGYLDVIALHAAGIVNVVASLGTALGQRQAQLLKRYTGKVFIAYDGDTAGQNAMLRGLDVLNAVGLEVRVIVIPGGLDPDDYVKRHGREGFFALKNEALTVMEYKLSRFAVGIDFDDVNLRQAYAKKACELISQLDPIERERYVLKVSRETGISVSALNEQCLRLSGNNPGNDRYNSEKKATYAKKQSFTDERIRLQMHLLACMLKGREACLEITRLSGYDSSNIFTDKMLNRVAIECINRYRNNQKPDMTLIMAMAEEYDAANMLAAVLSDSEGMENPLEVARDCIKGIKVAELTEEYTKCTEALASASDSEKKELVKKISELAVEINRLKLK